MRHTPEVYIRNKHATVMRFIESCELTFIQPFYNIKCCTDTKIYMTKIQKKFNFVKFLYLTIFKKIKMKKC